MKPLVITLLVLLSLPSMAFSQLEAPDPLSYLRWQQKVMLLTRRAARGQTVAQELKVTKDQRIALAGVHEELMIFMEEGRVIRDLATRRQAELDLVRSIEEKLKLLLSEEQLKRLDQLDLQQDGAQALTRPEIARKLNLNAAQRLRISDAMSGQFRGGKDFGVACYHILNETQRKAWEELLGEPSESVTCRAPVAPVAPAGQQGGILPGGLALPGGIAPPVGIAGLAANEQLFYLPFARLRNPALQKELKLTDEQIAKLTEAGTKLEELRRLLPGWSELHIDKLREHTAQLTKANSDYRSTLTTVLNESQKQRITQIRMQEQGANAFLSREFREEAKLTDDQINELDQLIRDRQSEKAAPKHPPVSANSNQRRIRETYDQETVQLALKRLSDIQRGIWDQKVGNPAPIDALFDVAPTPEK